VLKAVIIQIINEVNVAIEEFSKNEVIMTFFKTLLRKNSFLPDDYFLEFELVRIKFKKTGQL
jgi:hypothetical protein